MSSFTTPLVVEPLDDGRRWRVRESFSYYTDVADAPEWLIVVPVGFDTDFASIPRVFWALLPPTGRYGKAAVVHDYLYRCTAWPRAVCDRVFREAMEVLGVSWLTRHALYRAVRLWGGMARRGQTQEPPS